MIKQRIRHAGAFVSNAMNGPGTIVHGQRQMVAMNEQIMRASIDLAHQQLVTSPRYADPKRLLAYGYKGYSQGDEDGIIDEIFRRIGTTNRSFVEFGVGNGLENNTAALLLGGWSGAWIDGSDRDVAQLRQTFAQQLREQHLRVQCAFITAENIEALFDELGVPAEPDLVSIDIDNNDYWIWRALTRHRPRVVVIEYNPAYGRTARCVLTYRPDRTWGQTSYQGASLSALEALGREKGYSLVGCGYQGTNAFFVRDDTLGNHFCTPYTTANHYEPARYWYAWYGGHGAGWGDIEQV